MQLEATNTPTATAVFMSCQKRTAPSLPSLSAGEIPRSECGVCVLRRSRPSGASDDQRVGFAGAEVKLGAQVTSVPRRADASLGEEAAARQRQFLAALAVDEPHVDAGAAGIERHDDVAAASVGEHEVEGLERSRV